MHIRFDKNDVKSFLKVFVLRLCHQNAQKEQFKASLTLSTRFGQMLHNHYGTVQQSFVPTPPNVFRVLRDTEKRSL